MPSPWRLAHHWNQRTSQLNRGEWGPPLISLKARDPEFVFVQFQEPDQRVTLVAKASEEEQIGGEWRKSRRWRRMSWEADLKPDSVCFHEEIKGQISVGRTEFIGEE